MGCSGCNNKRNKPPCEGCIGVGIGGLSIAQMTMFVNLYNSNSGINGYKKKLGMSPEVVKLHLTKIIEYKLTVASHQKITELKRKAGAGEITNLELLSEISKIRSELDKEVKKTNGS